MAEATLSKTYNPAETEPRVIARWDETGAFHADPARILRGEAEPYCIFIPPPNVTAALHLGHALNNTLQDVLIRARRMMGFETLWMPGTDHAGIATQAVVERRIKKEEGLTRQQLGREAFVARVQAFKDEYEATITAQLKAMGCSCDWSRQRFTMDDQCAAAVREAFFRLFKNGLIYRGKRLVNWDPVLQTAVADDECYDEEIDGKFYYLRYPLAHPHGATTAQERAAGAAPPDDAVPVTWGELAARGYPDAEHHPSDERAWITVATTRPETYLGDTAVAVNPKDPRAVALRGLWVELPLVGRLIPVVEDDYVVLPAAMQADPEEAKKDPKAAYASGFLKVTPAHDPNDWELGRRHGLKAINVMAPDGSISDKHGWTDVGDAHVFVGKKREEARKLAVAEFEARGLLEDVKPYRHSVKHSDRSKAIVEPYLSDQWWVRVTDDRLAPAANRALVPDQRPESAKGTAGAPSSAWDGTLTFFPARYARTYQQWHEGIRDWCISRQLWWGHRIPVWTLIARAPGPDDRFPDYSPDATQFLGELERRLDKFRVECGLAPDSFAISDGGWSATGGRQFFVAARSSEAANAMNALAQEVNRPASDLSAGDTLELTPPLHVPAVGSDIGYMVDAIFQDPDVLDTWFSSALWPLSTLGWPDPQKFNASLNAGALEAFNPSSVLCTAREIITLWVSRMVMFNRYFLPEGWNGGVGADRRSPARLPDAQAAGDGRGPVPFRDVFIHAMIQDGEGRKMSKTLGNGVDPRDIIESHGADAMRFTLVQMTTQTQDVRMPVKRDARTGKNTSEKFDAGRNYCNKLWNTARFVLEKLGGQSAGAGDSSQPVSAREMGLIDRWMMSRLARTVAAVDAAIGGYEFSDYADAMYRLLWWDLCDWYLEAVKPTVEGSPAQRAVLAHALEVIVRLLHPITPFITEAIWEHLRNVETRPVEHVDLASPRKGGLLATAGWPRVGTGWIDEPAEQAFERLRELVTAVRNARSEHQVPPKRKVTLHATPAGLEVIRSAPGVVETLCGLERVESLAGPVAGSVVVRALGEEMWLSGLTDAGAGVDKSAERDRLTRQLEQLRKSENTMAGRLANPGYVERAPAKLVEESRAQLAKVRDEIAAIEAKLAALG